MSLNRASLYGESIFTSFRSINGRVFQLNLHLKRFFEGVNAYYFKGRLTYDQFVGHYLEGQLLVNHYPNHYFRLTFIADEAPGARGIGLSAGKVLVEHKEIIYRKEQLKVKSMPSPYTKYSWQTKAGSYFEAFKSRGEAQSIGFDEVLFFQTSGVITELSTSRIVLQKGAVFYTPNLPQQFKSLGLAQFESFCEKHNYALEYTDIKLQDLKDFEGAFGLNSVRLIQPIIQIDQIDFEVNREVLVSFLKEVGPL